MGTTSSDWNVGGALTVAGTADFTGAVTLTGAITVGGALAVTGATSLNGTLYVSGAADLDGAIDVAGAAAVGGALDVTGNITGGAQVVVGGSDATDMIGTSYDWMYLDGTNRPAFSSFQLYDVGTGSMVSVYASNGVIYAQ